MNLQRKLWHIYSARSRLKKNAIEYKNLNRPPVQREPEKKMDSGEKFSALNEEQAMTLLDEPSPDGDNLERDPELTDASGDGEGDNNSIPVISVMKINGVHFRIL